MIESAESAWLDWAGGAASGSAPWRGRVLFRGGRPLLYLPMEPRRAAAALDLYAAQSPRARWLKHTLRCAARLGLPLPVRAVTLPHPADVSLLTQLKVLGFDCTAGQLSFGLLVGNGAPDRRRFLLLALDGAARPTAVVKLGTGARARELIRHERGFLKNAPRSVLRSPTLLGGISTDRVDALALEHAAGGSPRHDDVSALADVLDDWVLPQAAMPFFELPPARELAGRVWPDAFQPLRARLESLTVSPVWFHGDLAPWNVKVSGSGAWTILDWERASVAGPPGWDWFHFVLQPEILVHRRAPAALELKVDELLREPRLQAYASRAMPGARALDVLIANLLWMALVVRPDAGRERTLELAERLTRRDAA